MEPASPNVLHRLAWMVGIWTASVLALGVVASVIKLVLR